MCVQLGSDVIELFGVKVGRSHTKCNGPHIRWSCQLVFDASQFDRLISWLDRKRNGFDVLIHGLTGNALEDRTSAASWLGNPVERNLEIFRS